MKTPGPRRPIVHRSVFLIGLITFLSMSAAAQDQAAFYRANCGACHTIGGGPRVGPDLKGVTQRKDREWLLRFIQDPKGVLDSGDAYAKKVVAQSHGMVMPAVPGVDHGRAEGLLNFIDSQSGSAQPGSGSVKAATAQPVTTADISRGKELVVGNRALSNGGAPCVSCHTVHDLASLGGGRLGPDLTRSVERLGGSGGMAAWLEATPTPTMRAAYRDHALETNEIRELVAYFEWAAKQDQAHPESSAQWPASSFLLIGIGGGLAALAVMELFWRNRFRGVRRSLVTAKRGQAS